MEHVIIVDKNDKELGKCCKQKAHKQAIRHRAFSIFIFNSKGQLLIQKRHPKKYHSGGLWSNSCCSHPTPGQTTDDAANMRLKEEMGIHCTIRKVSSFSYLSKVGDNIFEHEYDHIYSGISDETPQLNHDEAIDFKWVGIRDLLSDMTSNKASYTTWFKMIMNDYEYRRLLDPELTC